MESTETRSMPAQRTRSVAFVGLTIAIIAVSAWVVVPIGPIPFTLQMFAITFAIVVLSPKEAIAAITGYLLLGAVGVPVFSGMRGGISTYDSPDTFHFVDPPYINSDCGHYEGTFDEYCMEKLLQLLEQVKGKFMLTMFPLPMIEEYANKNGWIIHRVERTISASKTSRRKQEEWMVCNYEEHPQRTLFDYKDCGVVDTTDAS